MRRAQRRAPRALRTAVRRTLARQVTAAVVVRRTRGQRRKVSQPSESPLPLAPQLAAQAASLRYVSDDTAGIQRKRRGRGFFYSNGQGRAISETATLERIRALAIPPAWTEVWICSNPSGHLQATGRDARGRKQYIYHPRWREIRDATKYERMLQFGAALPRIRRRVVQDLKLPGIPREKILATLVRLLETTFIRVGNKEYARTNDSYGLTTLRDHHVRVNGSAIRFQFNGKSGKSHTIHLSDPHLARVIRRCQELPGQDLFQYVDEAGEPRSVGSADLNEYLREIAGADFTAKDFRTWAGTLMAATRLTDCKPCRFKTQRTKTVTAVLKDVSHRLGNTVAICRKCYVHPAVLQSYVEGVLAQRFHPGATRRQRLSNSERALLKFLAECSGSIVPVDASGQHE